MAKRRGETGKTGKHQHGVYDYSYDYGRAGSGGRRLLIAIVAVIIVIVVIVAAYFFLILDEDGAPEKDEVTLTTDTPFQGGYPMDDITFDFTIKNPDAKSDIFSPMVTGLPSDWNLTIPATVTVDGEDSMMTEFTVVAPYEEVNKSYPFKLEVTSAETQRTYTLDYEAVIFHAFYGIEMVAYNRSNDAEPGAYTHYGLIITNLGNGDDTITLSYVENQLPSGWTVDFEYDEIEIPQFETRAVRVNITTSPSTSKGRYDMRFIATSSGGPSASVWLNTSLVKDFGNRTIVVGDKVKVDYIGYFINGTIFDTSVEEVAHNENYSRDERLQQQVSFSPLGMYVNGTDPDTGDAYNRMIDGFWKGSIGMKSNETRVVRIPPDKAYTDPTHHLYGKVLIFEITVKSIDT